MPRQSFGTFATLSNTDRLPLVRGDAARQRAVRRVCRVGGPSVLLFALADDHLHVVVREVGASAAHLLSCIAQALVRGDGVPQLDDRLVKQVYTRAYLQELVRYHCTQGVHHGIPELDWTGGCLLDLIGARILPGFERSWRKELLPRLDDRALVELIGLRPLCPFSMDHVVAPERLVAAGSLLVGLDLRVGRSRDVVGGRRVVLEVAREAFGEVGPTVDALGISLRAAQRLLTRPPRPELVVGLERLLAWRAAVPEIGTTRGSR